MSELQSLAWGGVALVATFRKSAIAIVCGWIAKLINLGFGILCHQSFIAKIFKIFHPHIPVIFNYGVYN